jgi:UDP-GlcNAc:undecaprenyl-phosphate GlcNAc-1-phosphate transferase
MVGFLIVHAVLLAALAAVAWGVAWVVTQRRFFVDEPGPRSSHTAPTPRGGGLGIVVAALLGWIVFWSAGFASQPFARPALGLMLGATIVAAAELLDDWRRQGPAVKFGLQALAAAIAVGCGLEIRTIALPYFGPVDLGWLAPVVTFLWLVGLTNAFNFMDGLDALAAGGGLIAALFLVLIAWLIGAGPIAAMALALGAGCAGFLRLNRPPARVFMGDVGSQFTGFAFAGLGAFLGLGDATGALALVVPLLLLHFLFDTILTAARRLAAGENVFAAHRGHLYQRLNAAGLDHGAVATWLAIAGVVNGVFAVALVSFAAAAPWLAFVAPLWLQGVYVWLVVRREREAAATLASG